MIKQKRSRQRGKKKEHCLSRKRNLVHAIETPNMRRAFSKVRRQLSEKELSSPAVQRLLLDELDHLELQVIELSKYIESSHELEKENSVLRERTRKTTASEIMYGVCLTVGACLIGLAPYLWSNRLQGYLSLVIGGILIISGLVSRAVRK